MSAAWRGFVRAWNAIPLREPWRLLVPLLAIHWIALVIFTTRVNHNGWLFYQGGDQILYWTAAWLLGTGSLTVPVVSHAWSLVLVPLAWIGGPGFLGALPEVMLLQALVLAPIAAWCMYELGARIGGRAIGYLAAALWTLGPYLVIPLFVQRYHEKYVEQYLPIPLGLTGLADYAGTVCLLAAAVFAVRSVESRDPHTAALAGLLVGFAALVKPSNLIFVAAPVVLYLAARRWRELAVAALAVVPALIALTVWKYRGYGYVPAFAYQELHVALGIDTLRAPYDRYAEINWQQLDGNLASLREVFASMRVLQWLPIAGAIAVARRSVPISLFLSVWFWTFFVLKGSSLESNVDSGTFFRFLLPAMPAFVLLVAALPVLFPRYGAELARRTTLPKPRAIGRRAAIVAVCLLGLVPIAAAAAVRPLQGPGEALDYLEITVPVDRGLELEATVSGTNVLLRWQSPPTNGSSVFYRLLRSPAATDSICFTGDGADRCTLVSLELDTFRQTRALDRPGMGTWTYRVGAAANWVDDPELGDVFLLSNPVTVRVP